MCQYFVKKSDSAANTLTLDMAKSHGCPNLVHFQYGATSKSTVGSPCSNVPLHCPSCDKKDPAVWRYNMQEHLMRFHPDTSLTKHAHIWEMGAVEHAGMQKLWDNKDKSRRRAPKKTKYLVISAAHSSRNALRQVTSKYPFILILMSF